MITKTKQQCWEELCKELEEDIWGTGYKIATKKLVGYAPFNLAIEEKLKVARDLFPKRSKSWQKAAAEEEVELFTEQELNSVLKKMKTGKAPGLDGVPMEVIKKIEEIAPTVMLRPINGILKEQSFPSNWKKAKLVLIPKGNPEDMKLRPICLLSSFGKLYEGLVRDRMEKELEATGGLSDNQYGFRKGRSTIQAVEKVVSIVRERRNDKWAALITLDVKNAFNTASWDHILGSLQKRGISSYLLNIIDNYLEGRSLYIEKGTCMEITAGVPQGSVLGPTLWNVMYDDVLREIMPEGVHTLAYADDLAIVINARSKEELKWKGDEALQQINSWMQNNELELAPHKSEVIILKGQRNREDVFFKCGEAQLHHKRSIVYLGITLGENSSFGQHIKTTVEKAEKKVTALTRITPNIRGPGSKKREMLYNVVQSILLYGAPIWCDCIKIRKYRQMIIKTQRKMLIRVTSAYRTVSAKAVQVVAGIIPIDLLVEERQVLYHRREENIQQIKVVERTRTIEKWQELWNDTADVAQWTKQLIQNLSEWVKCTHRRADYFLTQVLTGHGSFKVYTKRIGKTEDDNCEYCGQVDTVAHTLFECGRWQLERRQTNQDIGMTLTTQNMIPTMIEDRKNWDLIHSFVRKIMKEKETEERQFQQNRTG